MVKKSVIVDGLTKSFRKSVAVDKVSFEVDAGSIFGLLGPNGAGKTTLVRMLATLLSIDQGRAIVGGFDVASQPNLVRSSIGLSGQFAAVDETLSGRENLVMVAMLYGVRRKVASTRASELLERFELTEAADRPTRTYSGGMRRRLDLAATLVASPPILFLDEPTSGLDPRSRAGLWELIENLVREGTTIILTTQYLEEADRLASLIGLIDKGILVKLGSPAELKRGIGGEFIRVTTVHDSDVARATELLERIAVAAVFRDSMDGSIKGLVSGGASSLFSYVRAVLDAGIEIDEVGLVKPNLDDVFLRLTGVGND